VTVTCPQGHPSASTDYCDTCGAPITSGSPSSAPGDRAASSDASTPPAGDAPGASETTACPHCGTANPPGALFCEACGYDFTTGALPRSRQGPGGPVPAAGAAGPPPIAPAVELEWVAEVWVEPEWYAEQDAEDPCPSPGLPVVVPLTVRSLLVGRVSRSRSIHPEVDCGADIGVSRRHAQLSTDGTRWWIEDLQSSNGTYVGRAGEPLPSVPLVPGQRRELGEDDRVYIGAWTRIVVRRATDEERAGS
jgi:hypothetical protein